MSRLDDEAVVNYLRAQARYTLAKIEYDAMVAMAAVAVPQIYDDYKRALDDVRAAAEELLERELRSSP